MSDSANVAIAALLQRDSGRQCQDDHRCITKMRTWESAGFRKQQEKELKVWYYRQHNILRTAGEHMSARGAAMTDSVNMTIGADEQRDTDSATVAICDNYNKSRQRHGDHRRPTVSE
jgi:hypothetical protein